MVFHSSLSDSKFPQLSWTFLSNLTDLNNAVVWMVLRFPTLPVSLIKPSWVVPTTPITIGISVTFMFHSFFFFSSLARSK